MTIFSFSKRIYAPVQFPIVHFTLLLNLLLSRVVFRHFQRIKSPTILFYEVWSSRKIYLFVFPPPSVWILPKELFRFVLYRWQRKRAFSEFFRDPSRWRRRRGIWRIRSPGERPFSNRTLLIGRIVVGHLENRKGIINLFSGKMAFQVET